MYKVKWTTPAQASLKDIESYIARDNPIASKKIVKTLLDLVDSLETSPLMGVGGKKPNTRELVSSKYPYIVIYRVQTGFIQILNVIHTRRQYPPIKASHKS